MKRVLLTLVGTVGGVVALLSYKTHGQVLTSNAALPSAGLPGISTSTSAPVAAGSASSSQSSSTPAPSSPASSSPAPSSPGHSTPAASSAAKPAAAASSPTKPPATAPKSSAPTSSAAKPTPSVAPAASTYTGSAITTRYGIVQVKVTVQNKKITNVAFVQLTAFDGHSAEINSEAAPILLQETISAQSANIDSVSGASYTSEGYVESLQSALDQAGIK